MNNAIVTKRMSMSLQLEKASPVEQQQDYHKMRWFNALRAEQRALPDAEKLRRRQLEGQAFAAWGQLKQRWQDLVDEHLR